ncbi:hypothetical protein ACIPW5_25290 [Streptomyces sp. NPDC090077]|uniref:hypothetical protein n=1 Tax=Streptomyces sp. NPDC090077 TaxID=3365938 RepID=UPI003827FF49
MSDVEATSPKLPPSYPPKSPPPPKKPVEAPRPQPAVKPSKQVEVRAQPRMIVRNRRTVALTFRADPWAPKKAARQAVEALHGWGYPGLDEGDAATAVQLLVTAAVTDGGKRISVHLGDQDHKVLIAVLSHVAGPPDETVLSKVAALATVDSAGTDTGDDGRRIWAVLDTTPRPKHSGHTAA